MGSGGEGEGGMGSGGGAGGLGWWNRARVFFFLCSCFFIKLTFNYWLLDHQECCAVFRLPGMLWEETCKGGIFLGGLVKSRIINVNDS